MKKSPDMSEHVDWFRNSAPYIHAHRGKTVVVLFGGEAVENECFHHLINDIALLGSGAFMTFEGWSGWCAVRAMGFKTPL